MVRLVDAPAGVTQEEGHTGFLRLPSAVRALITIARKIQPSLSLVDHEVDFPVETNLFIESVGGRVPFTDPMNMQSHLTFTLPSHFHHVHTGEGGRGRTA